MKFQLPIHAANPQQNWNQRRCFNEDGTAKNPGNPVQLNPDIAILNRTLQYKSDASKLPRPTFRLRTCQKTLRCFTDVR